MPAGMGEEERFAAAVEHGTTPASIGGAGDSATSVARELEIVALLRAGGPALAPDPAARARAKRRLMAAFAQELGGREPRGRDLGAGDDATGPLTVLAPVALAERPAVERAEHTVGHDVAPLRRPRAGRHSAPEPDAPSEPVAEPDVEEDDNVRPLRRRSDAGRRGHSRAALVGAAAAAALVAIAGTGTFASRNALPGDSMYGIKRVAESTGYALTFGEQAKARRHLEQAQRRLDEVEGLVARHRSTTSGGTGASGRASATTSNPDLVSTTMQEFDADTTEGSRQLLSGPTPDTGQVDEVRTWATQQSQRLSDIRSDLPAQDRVDQSLALLNQVLGETAALQGDPSASSGTTSGRATDAPTTDPDATARAGTSAKARHGDDTDGATEGDTDVDTRSTGDVDSDDTGRASARSQGSARRDDSDDRRKRSDDDGGGSGGSGGASAGDSGSGDISVPLAPVPVNVPSPVPGLLPGVRLG